MRAPGPRREARAARAGAAPLALAASLAVAACLYRDNRLYCDEHTPCRDPVRPFCDLEGRFPASESIASTCIPDPFEGVVCAVSGECGESAPICDPELRRCRRCGEAAGGDRACLARSAETPACAADGRCVQCAQVDHCPAEQPRCGVDGQCAGCEPGPGGEALCAARGDGRAHCSAAGACVTCLVPAHCSQAERPVCGEDGQCRACTGPLDCPSGSCDLASGACTAPASRSG